MNTWVHRAMVRRLTIDNETGKIIHDSSPMGYEAGRFEPGTIIDADRADEIAAARRAGSRFDLPGEMAAEVVGWPLAIIAIVGIAAGFAALFRVFGG